MNVAIKESETYRLTPPVGFRDLDLTIALSFLNMDHTIPCIPFRLFGGSLRAFLLYTILAIALLCTCIILRATFHLILFLLWIVDAELQYVQKNVPSWTNHHHLPKQAEPGIIRPR